MKIIKYIELLTYSNLIKYQNFLWHCLLLNFLILLYLWFNKIIFSDLYLAKFLNNFNKLILSISVLSIPNLYLDNWIFKYFYKTVLSLL